MKKIKDVTVAEVRRICKLNHTCSLCPLYAENAEIEDQGFCLIDKLDLIPTYMLNKEIEVIDEQLQKHTINVSSVSEDAWEDLINYISEHDFRDVKIH